MCNPFSSLRACWNSYFASKKTTPSTNESDQRRHLLTETDRAAPAYNSMLSGHQDPPHDSAYFAASSPRQVQSKTSNVTLESLLLNCLIKYPAGYFNGQTCKAFFDTHIKTSVLSEIKRVDGNSQVLEASYSIIQALVLETDILIGYSTNTKGESLICVIKDHTHAQSIIREAGATTPKEFFKGYKIWLWHKCSTLSSSSSLNSNFNAFINSLNGTFENSKNSIILCSCDGELFSYL